MRPLFRKMNTNDSFSRVFRFMGTKCFYYAEDIMNILNVWENPPSRSSYFGRMRKLKDNIYMG